MSRPRIKRIRRLLGREQPINAATARPEKAEKPEGSDADAAGPSPVVPAGEHLTSPASTTDTGPEASDGETTTPPPAQAEAASESGEAETAEAPAAAPEAAALGAAVQADKPDEADQPGDSAASKEAKKAEKARKSEEAKKAKEARRAEKAKRREEARKVKEARKAEKAKKALEAQEAKKAKKTAQAEKADKTTKPDEAKTEVQPAVAAKDTKKRKLPRGVLVAGILVLVAGATAGGLLASGVLEDDDDDEPAAEAPAPIVSGLGDGSSDKEDAGGAASQLGFPAFATKNTTRVGGSDASTTAAGAALAVFPSAGGSEPPEAVAMVSDGDWQAGIAAAVLMAEPVRAPLLVSVSSALPPATEEALNAMSPQGSPATGGSSVFAVGDDAAAPADYKVTRVTGSDPATIAAGVAKLRRKLTKKAPRHIVVATLDDAAYAMPAAAWAARSGDPVLFTETSRLPGPTAAFLQKNENVPVYVLGSPDAVSDEVIRQISRVSSQVFRVGGDDPVTNAIEFARFVDGSFGWNINDPGHGFVVARSDRPMDAGAAAPISASGTWGPLLLTEEADTLPGALRGYLLDLKPGYQNDPTRALYNRVWVIGDEEAIDVNQQAALDDLAELARIDSGG